MNVNKYILSLSLIGLFSLCVLHNTFYFPLTTVVILLIVSFYPGWLLYTSIQGKIVSRAETILYSIGGSISIILFIGLLSSFIYPFFGITKPLTTFPLLVTFDCLMILLTILQPYITIHVHIPRFFVILKWILICFFITIFPLISAYGAYLLNNGYGNHLILYLLFVTGTVFIILTICYKAIPDAVYLLFLYGSALAMILMFSLRSPYVYGFDINTEYKIFQITKEAGIWSMSNIQNAYNATISVPILSTVLQSFLHIPDPYIFKAIYQLFFAITPLGIFLIMRRYLPSIVSFLGSFFFIVQPQFMQELPAITRQEIAFIFFMLVLLVLFDKTLSHMKRSLLLFTFMLSLVLSHYSSSFIAIALLFGTYFMITFYNIFALFIKKTGYLSLPKFDKKIPFRFMLVFFLFTFFWYGLYTNSLGDITQVPHKLINSLIYHKKNTLNEQDYVTQGIAKNSILENNIQTIQLNIRQYEQHQGYISHYFTSSDLSIYTPIQKFAPTIPIKNIVLNTLLTRTTLIVIGWIIKLFNIAGIIALLVLLFKKNKTEQILPELFALSSIGTGIVVAGIIFSFISQSYNLDRLYQQSLFILVIPIFMGATLFIRSPRVRYVFLAIILTFYLLSSSGVITQLTGGNASANLNNFGEDYDRFYMHSSDFYAARWIENNAFSDTAIYTDNYGQLRLKGATRLTHGIYSDLSPFVIDKLGYIYADYANIKGGIARSSYLGTTVTYEFPKTLFNNQKNIIYSNGNDIIYK